jgi:zinc transport system ATP-binding protein
MATTVGSVPVLVDRPALALLDGVTFSYGGPPVLRDVSIRLHPGELVALVGPNGSGKSTLLRILVGRLRPQAGRAELFGADPRRLHDRSRLGYVPQRPSLAQGLTGTVADIVGAGRLVRRGWRARLGRRDREVVAEAIAAVELEAHAGRPVRELSGGQQQRTFIARALAGEPDLLVLDEPTAGVDVESQRAFRRSVTHLRDRGGSVLLVSHELGAVADELDRVVVLKEGIRFDGPPQQLAEEGVSLGIHAHDLPVWLEDMR